MKQMVNIRSEYDSLYAKYEKIGKGKVRLTQSALILSVPIDPNKTTYSFPILESDQTPAPSGIAYEQRLNINDVFIANAIGLYIGANLQDENFPSEPNYRWLTTPLTELGGLGTRQENLYNGKISISVNNVKYVEKWDTKKHQYVAVTQAQGSSAGQPFATLPAEDMAAAGIVNVTPNINFSGSKKNEIVLDLPTPILTFTAAMNVGAVPAPITLDCDRIFLKIEGWLAQNAAAFQQ